jgi:hypothetical protein
VISVVSAGGCLLPMGALLPAAPGRVCLPT